MVDGQGVESNVNMGTANEAYPFPINQLRTPCYIVDADIAKANADRMLERAKVSIEFPKTTLTHNTHI